MIASHFYNVSVYKRMMYNDVWCDAVITLRVNASDLSEVIYEEEEKTVCTIKILDDAEG